MKKKKLFGIVMILSLSLSACHMRRQSDHGSNYNSNSSTVEDNGHDDTGTYAEYSEPSTISEFQETHQDLIAEIETAINQAEERIAIQLEEFVAGIWENVQDPDETVEITDGSFIRRINGEVAEEGYLYIHIMLASTRVEFREAITVEHETFLNNVLRDVKELSLENLSRTDVSVPWEGPSPLFAFFIVEERDESVDPTTNEPFIEIRFASANSTSMEMEPTGISVNSQAFRRPR